MRIADLIRFGVPKRILDLWKESGLEYLLPMQVEAIQNYGLLEGKSLLISAPTSSGKTLCGEMAAIRAINNNQRAIMLVPLKAIATEKYFEMKKKYRKSGLNIVAISSDYPENDKAFIKGDYHLAIAVYEKLNSLTSNDIRPLENLGVVVMDELQLVGGSDRGLAYELAISKILGLSQSTQKIGLIGGLDNCDEFCRWFDCALLKSANRPIELYRGVLFDGKFHYRRHNDCREGIEYFTAEKIEKQSALTQNIPDELIGGIRFLVKQGEQAMFFVSTRLHSANLALGLAELLNLPPAQQTLDSLEIIPDTLQKANLITSLKGGVGFHNADLSHSIRQLLEDGFRGGDIKIMVSTSTLAMGVNFPSKNVFIDAMKYYDGRDGKPVQRPLLTCDYNQIAGRAGRLGHTGDFGRAIFIASDDTSREALWESYIYGTAKAEIEPLNIEQCAGMLLHWISCGLVRDQRDADHLFKTTFRGRLELLDNDTSSAAMKILLDNGFLELKGYRFDCTAFGKSTAAHNIDLNTALQIRAGYVKERLGENRSSWLYYLLDTPAGKHLHFSGNQNSHFMKDYRGELASIYAIYREDSIGPLAEVPEIIDSRQMAERLDKLLILASLAIDIPMIQIERSSNTGYGRIREMGKGMANIFRAAAEIGYPSHIDTSAKTNLEIFADCLYWGVPESGLPLARLKAPLLERDFILRLNHAGLFTCSDIINASLDIVASLIPQVVAEKLMLRCQKQLAVESQAIVGTEPISRTTLLARKIGERYEVILDGITIKLQPRLFGYLSKLYNCDHPDGWLDKNFLDSGINQVKYIYCLKNALSAIPGATIEGDSAGRYRLILPESVNKSGQIAKKQRLAADGGG
jgi:replicative superfamily II helicase